MSPSCLPSGEERTIERLRPPSSKATNSRGKSKSGPSVYLSPVRENWGTKGVKRGEASMQVFTRSERINEKSTNKTK